MLKIIIVFLLLVFTKVSIAQDTLRVSLAEFIEQGIRNSDLLKAEFGRVDLADNRYLEAKGNRFFPRINLSSNHGIVPNIISDSSRNRAFLDPNLRNDWENPSVFSQFEFSALTPIFTWGAVTNGINAARKGAEAALFQFEAKQSEYAIKLYQLYYARLLGMEMERLLEDARKDMKKAEDKLKEMEEDPDGDIDQVDIYKFKIYRHQFNSKADEVALNNEYIAEMWNLVLMNQDKTKVVLPREVFLDPMHVELKGLDSYELDAIAYRPELKAIHSAERAAKYALDAQNAQFLPSLFMGFRGEYVYTPRPVQQQPMIGDRYSYANVIYTFGLRQNLNFSTVKIESDRLRIQMRQSNYLRSAILDGIRAELLESFKTLRVSQSKMNNSRDALQVSKEWLRQEQIDYDLDIGEVKNLIEAVKTNMELEAGYRQAVYEFNLNLGKFHKSVGLPLIEQKK